MAIIRDSYVDALEESVLAERCVKGMEGFLGARKPKPLAPAGDPALPAALKALLK